MSASPAEIAGIVDAIKNDATIQLFSAILFGIAVIHTFLVKKFEHIAHKFPNGSPASEFFHFLGEVEAVFGMWAGVLVLFLTAFTWDIAHGMGAVYYLESLDFVEPVFVFVIMCVAGTRPIIKFAESMIIQISRFIPLKSQRMSFYVSALIVGPLLGSFITEPAAMTVTALILQKNFYSDDSMSLKFKYATLGLLFVNVSIGGTLTHFAAPPVLMVAKTWGWGMSHMLGHFGYKAAISVIVGTFIIAFRFKDELKGKFELKAEREDKMHPKWWITTAHLVFMGLIVLTNHHMVIFLGLFLFFLGFATVTNEYQDKLKLKESLLVGFFLGGLVVLGKMQGWWLEPIVGGLSEIPLYLGATALTGITDNAALTYLGAQIQGFTEAQKYYLVAGAVTGGGLTVIANAPNPAGFGILKENFGKDGISPVGLLKSALLPTGLALIAFKIFASL